MSRLEKKCVIGSAAFHGLLLVIVLFGAAFLPSKTPDPSAGVITIATGPLNVGAGTPAVNSDPAPVPPAPEAHPPQPQPDPPKPVEPVKPPEEAHHDPVKPKQPKRDLANDAEKDKGPLPVKVKPEKKDSKDNAKSSLTKKVIVHSNMVDKAAMQLAQAQRAKEERAYRDAQAQRAQILSEIKGTIGEAGKGLTTSPVVSSSGIDTSGGGVSRDYGEGLKTIYDANWSLNADAYDEETSACVRVVVQRDGTIKSATMTKSSGHAAFDRSVKAALNKVTRVRAFPPEMKDAEREFTWKFERKTRIG